MTANAAATRHVAPLRPVESANQMERFAFLLRARERAAALFNKATSSTRGVFRKIVHTLHLDSAWEAAKAAGGWVKDKALWLGRMLGIPGVLGLGMLGLSTGTGRTVVGSTVGRTLGVAGKVGGWAMGMVTGGLRHLGRPGRWAADKIDGAGNWAANQAVKAYKYADKKIGKQMELGSTTMRVTRLGGVLLLAQRLITAFGLPMPVVYLIGAATAFWGVYDAADIAIKVGESRGWLKVTEDKTTGAKKATASATAVVATPGAAANAQKTGSGTRRGH